MHGKQHPINTDICAHLPDQEQRTLSEVLNQKPPEKVADIRGKEADNEISTDKG